MNFQCKVKIFTKKYKGTYAKVSARVRKKLSQFFEIRKWNTLFGLAGSNFEVPILLSSSSTRREAIQDLKDKQAKSNEEGCFAEKLKKINKK